VTCELKGPGTESPTVRLLEETGMIPYATISSFNHDRPREAKRLCSQVRVGLLYPLSPELGIPENFVDCCVEAGATDVYIRYDLITKELVDQSHESGLHAWAWCRGHIMMEKVGVKSDESYDKVHLNLIETGCDGICTNRPDLLAKMRLVRL